MVHNGVYNNICDYQLFKTKIFHNMKNINTFNESKFYILQIAKNKLNRKLFCDLHVISASTLSRLLSGKQEVTFEMLDYICQEIGIKIEVHLR